MRRSRLGAYWMLFRPMPTLVWGLPAVLVGAALARRPWASLGLLALVIALAGAALAQGILAHAWNDLADQASGTDQLTQGGLSGGSGVLTQRRLTTNQLQSVTRWGLGLYGLLTLAGMALRGAPAALAALLGLYGAWSYSQPPFRFAYRPGGEWVAIFPAFAAAVWAGAVAAGAPWHTRALLGALVESGLCVTSVAHNHLLDLEADWRARPRKATTPAYWHYLLHRDPREPAWLAVVFTLATAIIGAIWYAPFWGSAAVAALAGAALAWGGALPPPQWLRRRDLALKALGLLQAVWLVVAFTA